MEMNKRFYVLIATVIVEILAKNFKIEIPREALLTVLVWLIGASAVGFAKRLKS